MKQYKKKNRVWFLGAWLCILTSNFFAVSLQFYKGDVLDYAINQDARETVMYIFILAAFILSEVLFYFLYNLFRAKFVTECTKCLKQDIFDRILRYDYVKFKEMQTGEYIAKYTNEADTIKSRFFSMLPIFWDIFSKIVFVSIALFLLDFRIALITIALLTTPLYIPKLIEKRLQQVQNDYLQSVERNLAKINDWLLGFEIIKNFSIEHNIRKMFTENNDFSMEKMLRDAQIGAISQLISTLISYLSYFIILVCSAYLVLIGKFSAGDFFIAIGMIDQLSYPLISLSEIIRQLIAIKSACISMEQFVEAGNIKQPIHEMQGFEKEINYDEVCFSYDRRFPVLVNFSFKIEKGKRYLLKGPSGCGKTTAVNLLLRYYDIDSGNLTVDGVPIGLFDCTYSCITVVRQEAILFSDTLRNNLTMYQDIPDSCLISVLNDVGLSKYANVEALDVHVVESGENLSGGEKKRICLARALLRNTEILIFDEPLANLDAETADKIENLLLAINNKTVLIVSHQFSEKKMGKFHQVLDFNS